MISDLMAAGIGAMVDGHPTLDVTDLFCGAGGGTDAMREAAELMGFRTRFTLVNHLPIAIETIRANFPFSRPMCEGVDDTKPRKLYPLGGLDALIGGPSCTEYSTANTKEIEQYRSTPWGMYEWAKELLPPIVKVENVKQFPKKWPDFQRWVKAFEALGYRFGMRVFCAADYGDPTTRERLFMLFVRAPLRVVFPDPTHSEFPDSSLLPWVPASEIIDSSIKGRWLDEMPGKAKYGGLPLSPKTLARIFAGLRISGLGPLIAEWDNLSKRGGGWRSVESPLSTIVTKARHGLAVPYLEPMVLPQHGGGVLRSTRKPLPTITTDGAIGLVESFLVKYYGTSGAVSLRKPLPTITTHDRFGLCCPAIQKDGKRYRIRIRWRMLQWHELAAAMSFRRDYKFQGNKAERVHQIGNAWPHCLARALILAVLSQQSDIRPFLRKVVAR